MTTKKTNRGPLRRALPWIAAIGAAQVAMRAGGVVLARRLDSGDETSSEIRRLRTFGQLTLVPVSTTLSRLRFDLMFAGLQLDLRQATPALGGIDVELTGLLAGGEIRLPRDWRVAWDRRGPTGVNIEKAEAIEHATDPATADLRVHVRGLFAGIGLAT